MSHFNQAVKIKPEIQPKPKVSDRVIAPHFYTVKSINCSYFGKNKANLRFL